MVRILVVTLFSLLVFSSSAKTIRYTVAKDGSGQFKTVQAAIDAVKDSSDAITIIFIKKGVYKEKLIVSEQKMNVHLVGEDRFETILTYDDYASKKDSTGKNIGTSGSSSCFIYGNGFSAEDLTFENSAGPVGQAVAMRVTGDRARFLRCRFLGFQDTLYTHGAGSRQFYYDCYIEGTVDFIFGAATAVFDHCILFGKQAGYYTAASTPDSVAYGYVFRSCRFIGDAPQGAFYLGRPWRPYASVLIYECELSALVNPLGWNNWSNAANEQTTRYAEFNNSGPGSGLDGRVAWSRKPAAIDPETISNAIVLNGWDPWK